MSQYCNLFVFFLLRTSKIVLLFIFPSFTIDDIKRIMEKRRREDENVEAWILKVELS
jgi:hypothetical protein